MRPRTCRLVIDIPHVIVTARLSECICCAVRNEYNTHVLTCLKFETTNSHNNTSFIIFTIFSFRQEPECIQIQSFYQRHTHCIKHVKAKLLFNCNDFKQVGKQSGLYLITCPVTHRAYTE